MSVILGTLLACSSLVNVETMNALVTTESAYNPYAIAIVSGAKPLKSQPRTKEEAERIIDELDSLGANYSVGLGQVNSSNFEKYGVTGKQLLDTCLNVQVSEKILAQCYKSSPNSSVAEALSCYYAGNFSYGFVKENVGKVRSSYVERVINNFKKEKDIVVPSIEKEIPQAIARVREPRKKNNHKNSPFKPVLIAKNNTSNSSSRSLIKNAPVASDKPSGEVAQSGSTFKF